jgi:hypothetical protein
MSASCSALSSLRSSLSQPAALDALKPLDNLALKPLDIVDAGGVGGRLPFAFIRPLRSSHQLVKSADHGRHLLGAALGVIGDYGPVPHAYLQVIELAIDEACQALPDGLSRGVAPATTRRADATPCAPSA